MMLLCLHVYLCWLRYTLQQLRMWLVVSLFPQWGHLPHLLRLAMVGNKVFQKKKKLVQISTTPNQVYINVLGNQKKY